MPVERSPIPAGAYLELDATLIDEGGLLSTVNKAIRRVVKEIIDFEREAKDKGKPCTGSGQVDIKITFARAEGSEEYFEVGYEAKTKSPTMKHATFVKERNGRLLCQPSGSNDDSPDQQLFFDARGRILGPEVPEGVNPETGEVAPVAGRIRRAAE